MKTAILLWLAIQLAFIGYVVVDTINTIHKGTYICTADRLKDKETVSPFYGALFPLFFYVPEPVIIKEYCKAKEAK